MSTAEFRSLRRELPPAPHHPIGSWIAPGINCLNLNYDAAIGPSFSSLVVVVRDWRGEVVLAMAKKANTTIPLQAKAENHFVGCFCGFRAGFRGCHNRE